MNIDTIAIYIEYFSFHATTRTHSYKKNCDPVFALFSEIDCTMNNNAYFQKYMKKGFLILFLTSKFLTGVVSKRGGGIATACIGRLNLLYNYMCLLQKRSIFLASQDALEVMGVTESWLADLTDVTLASDDT